MFHHHHTGGLLANADYVDTVRERRDFAGSLRRGYPTSRQIIDIRRKLCRAVSRSQAVNTCARTTVLDNPFEIGSPCFGVGLQRATGNNEETL